MIMVYFRLFFQIFTPLILLASPFLIWAFVMLILHNDTPDSQVQKKKTYRVLAIVAGTISALLVFVILAFCIFLTVGLAHM